MKKNRFTKKDFILIIILGITFLVVDYALNWYQAYKEHNLSTAIIAKYIPEINSEEFENYIQDNPNAFVYFGVNDDEVCRDFENKFKKTITKYHLKDEIIYFNTKDIDFEKIYLKYLEDKTNTPNVPVLIYFENSKIVDYINYQNSDLSEKNIIKFMRKYDGVNIQ